MDYSGDLVEELERSIITAMQYRTDRESAIYILINPEEFRIMLSDREAVRNDFIIKEINSYHVGTFRNIPLIETPVVKKWKVVS